VAVGRVSKSLLLNHSLRQTLKSACISYASFMGININVAKLFVFLGRRGDEIFHCNNYSTSVEGA
jgi:hypothetical protein